MLAIHSHDASARKQRTLARLPRPLFISNSIAFIVRLSAHHQLAAVLEHGLHGVLDAMQHHLGKPYRQAFEAALPQRLRAARSIAFLDRERSYAQS